VPLQLQTDITQFLADVNTQDEVVSAYKYKHIPEIESLERDLQVCAWEGRQSSGLAVCDAPRTVRVMNDGYENQDERVLTQCVAGHPSLLPSPAIGIR